MTKKKRSIKGNGNTPRARRSSSRPPGSTSSVPPGLTSSIPPELASSVPPAPLAPIGQMGPMDFNEPSGAQGLVPSAPAPLSAGAPLAASVVSHVGQPATRSGGSDVLVGHASMRMNDGTATAAAVQPIEPEASGEAIPSRDDDQEESGPRIVAYVPTKSDAPVEATATPQKKHGKGGGEDASIPPVVDADHEHFFVAGDKADQEHREARSVAPEPELETPEEKVLQKMSPAVRERRARFTKYVKWALGASAVVCLAAAIRVTVARRHVEPDPAQVAVTAQQSAAAVQEPVVAPEPAPQPPSAVESPVIADHAPQAEAPQNPPAMPAADPAPAGKAEQAAAAAAAPPAPEEKPAATEPDPKAAKQKKILATKALDRSDLKTAIEAGEQSVALDPTDDEAYLILGAAYQMKGKLAEARRVFADCTKQAKKGSVGECRAMLR